MPCSDSSSSMVIYLDSNGIFKSFEYAKITCGREIEAGTGLNGYFSGKDPELIVTSNFNEIVKQLNVTAEDEQFVLYSEWDALRSAIALYLGLNLKDIDTGRCIISSIEHSDEQIEIVEIIMPPKEMPKILPCNLAQQNLN